jgi:hypothetical protein
VLAAAGVSAMPVTVLALHSPSFVTPTTTTTTTTTTTAPSFVTPTIATTPPVIAAPTTTTAAPVIVTPTTTTTPLVIVTPTTPTTPPVIVTPTTAPGLDDLAQATVSPDSDGSDIPLGEIDTSGAVPEGLDLAAIPGAPEAPTPAADGPSFAAGLSCAYQCIKSGVAYPRGFGALLVVETHVPAQLFISVVDDNYDAVDHTSTGMVSEFSWPLDHLEPGRTYYAMVAATDDNDDTAYAYGQFDTLSERTVSVSIGDVTVDGGPQNVVETYVYLRVDGDDFWIVDPGSDSSSVYVGLDRRVDLVLFNFRGWETSQYTFCEGFDPDHMPSQGDNDDLCGSWNSASLDDLDLDVIPPGESRWTSVTIDTTFNTSSGDGVLPGDYGDPRFFHFSAPVTLEISYV